MPYNHFTNEIDGGEEPIGWVATTAIISFGVFFALAISLMVLDRVLGYDRVHNVIASFF